jgi:carboxypeptidase Taq
LTAYQSLEARARRVADIRGALAILGWDQRTMMPKGGNGARGDQIATLSQMAHEIMIAEESGALLDQAEAEIDRLDDWQAANLKEMRRVYLRATAIDPALVSALSKATSRAEMTWRDARARGDFKALLPEFEAVLGLVREEALALGSAFDLAPYDALLEGYEPDLRRADIDPIFDHLAGVLPDFIDDVISRQESPVPFRGPFPAARQKALGERLMATLGFDFAKGRLDESLHPFCGGTPDDVRLTARYDDSEFASGLMAILHETGHGLYSAGLPDAWRGQPVGRSLGMAVHESQSLLVEMQVCRSQAFLGYLAPLLEATFGAEPAFDPDNLHRHAIRVERGLIRVDADELTYPLHIILRYRLEQALLEGDLLPADLPGAWSEGIRGLLGVVPPDDGQGCLQDIHWPGGAVGYFPCYSLGAVMAAQFFQAADRADPAIAAGIGRGEFQPLLAWLRREIHGQGARFDMQTLLSRVTGRPLELQPYLEHLKARYPS